MIDEKRIERAALIGTAQVQEGIELPEGFHVPTDDPDHISRKLLLAAGTNAIMRKAGFIPLTADAFQKWEPAAAEILPGLGAAGIASLKGIMEEADQQLLDQYLELLSSHGRRIPKEFIVPLMQLAYRQRKLEQQVLMNAGERGRWLARYNPEWSTLLHAEEGNGDVWHTGAIELRAAYLGNFRNSDPAAARELFNVVIQQEATKDLVILLNAFAAGLSTADAPVLEQLMNSKSKDVRATTATLLARIPGHQLVQILFELAKPYIAIKGNMLLGRKLEVELPQAHQKEWQALGIAPKNARYPTERTAWLGQMIALIPPQPWYDHFGRNAEELVSLALKNEFHTTFLAAWTDAALLHNDRPMIEALLHVAVIEGVEKHRLLLRAAELWAALPERTTEAILLPIVKKNTIGEVMEVIQLIVLHQHPWSMELSKAVLEWLQRIATPPGGSTHWIHIVSQAMQRFMSPAVATLVPPILEKIRDQAAPTFIKALEQLVKRLRLRQRMIDSLNEPPLS
jgi:hypothetical protein